MRDDYRSDAAMLQSTPGTGRELGSEHPPDGSRTDEGEEADSRVRDQTSGEFDIFREHHLRPCGRKTSLVKDIDHRLAGQWRACSRLDNDRRSNRNGGRHLMDDQVERMVEGTYTDDHADRLVLRKSHPACRCCIEVHR